MIITIHDDFDLYKITYSGQVFRAKQLDDTTYSFVTGNNRLIISYLGDDKYDVSCDMNTWNNIWHDYFDLDTCYRDIRSLIPADDQYLSECADIGTGIRILKQDKFEMLISFIISQRKSIPAIKSSVEKLCNLYGTNSLFPTPAQLKDASTGELASCGLGYRTEYVYEAVQRVYHNEINLDVIDKYDDEALLETLKTFKGVGDKVANCVLLFAYHRTGCAPIDTWIKKVIDTRYNGVNPFPQYGKYAGVMQQYIFYAAQHTHTL